MSAICGCINLNGDNSKNDIINIAKEAFGTYYQKYKIDRHEMKAFDRGFMYCGVQYFNKEARSEVLPIVNEAEGLFFTADCVVDNREDMINDLGIADTSTSDGTIIYETYRKYGEKVVEKLRGIYSFVVYDRNKDKVYLCNDHFAQRCLFYTVREGVLFFSTLLYPLLSALKEAGIEYELYNKWLVEAISMRGPAMIHNDKETTAVKDILKVDAGNFVVISNDGSNSYVKYYDPINNIKVDKKMTDEKCRRLLHETLGNSVKNCIRTDGEVGILLSAGLDSSTIAGFAAPMLQKDNKKLFSFTSVPLSESSHKKDNYHMDDEREGVLLQCKRYPNIESEFFDCKDKNTLNTLDELVEVWEMPCKSEQNAVWTMEARKLAADKGCRIMLSGATGNCTVSAGDFFDLLHSYMSHFKFISAYKIMDSYLPRFRIGKKRCMKRYLKNVLGDIKKGIHNDTDVYENIVTRKDVGESVELTKNLLGEAVGYRSTASFNKKRQEIYLREAYAQIGEIDTKYSLNFGVLDRDPLRNVEFIEFLATLPQEFFVNGNFERRLVRDFLDDVVIDEVRLDIAHRGRQAADNAYRLIEVWDQYLPDIKSELYSDLSLTYLDKERLDEFFKDLNKDTLIENEMDMRMILDALSFVKFLKRIKYEV